MGTWAFEQVLLGCDRSVGQLGRGHTSVGVGELPITSFLCPGQQSSLWKQIPLGAGFGFEELRRVSTSA